MTQFPNDDQDLINFLRQNHPEVPPASPDLEQQILRQVQTLPHQTSRRYPRRGLIPAAAIAAGIVTTILSYLTFVPASPSQAELASLEAFIDSNGRPTVSSQHLNSSVWHFTDLGSE